MPHNHSNKNEERLVKVMGRTITKMKKETIFLEREIFIWYNKQKHLFIKR